MAAVQVQIPGSGAPKRSFIVPVSFTPSSPYFITSSPSPGSASKFKNRPISWSGKSGKNRSSLHNPPIRLSWLPTIVNTCSCKIAFFHRLRSSSNETTSICHVRFTYSSSKTQSTLPIGSWLIRSSTIYIGFHDFVQGYVRRYLF